MVVSKEYAEGWEASKRGVPLNRNPYLEGLRVPDPEDQELTLANRRYDDWRTGWKDKFHGQ